jgi:putative NADH-flavin reductase
MASKRKKVAKAVPFNSADLANVTKANPYIQRLIEDSTLRDNLTTAIDSAKSALDRLTSTKAPQKAVFEDKKLQKDIRTAAEAVRDAASSLSDAPKKRKAKKGLRLGRKLLIVTVGAAAALAGSEKLRSKVLDTLFGAEEEFQYTPPAGAPTTPPASPVTAA